MDPTAVLGLVDMMLIGALLVALLGRWARVQSIALASYGAHLLIAFFVYAKDGLTTAPDAIFYDAQAQELVATGSAQLLRTGKEGWPHVLASLYEYIAPTPLLGLVLNASICGITLCFVAASADELSLGSRRYAAWLLLLCPGYWYWGVLLLREPASWLLIAAVGWAGLRLTRHPTEVRAWTAILIGTIGLFWIRGPVALIVGLGTMAGLALSGQRRVVKSIGVAVFVLGGYVFLADRIRQLTELDATSVAFSRSALASARTGFEGSILSTIPRVLFGPYPTEWLVLGASVIPDAIYTITITILATLAFRKYGAGLCVLTPAVGIVMALAISSGNYGTMIRLRAEVMILVIPLAAWWLFDRRAKSRARAATQTDSAAADGPSRRHGAHQFDSTRRGLSTQRRAARDPVV